MEVGGFVIGVVGLAGLFSTCVDCFKLVQIFRSRRQDYDVLQTMLDNQQFHLIAWGMACGFVAPYKPNKSFDDPISAARNARIENTLEAVQSLLTNTDKLRNRYALKPHRQAQGLTQIEGSAPSAFARTFQNTKTFWNTSLQRTTRTAGSVLWTVNDKDKFAELIEALSKLIQDLEKLTEDLGVTQIKTTIVEYEMQIIGDEGSLEAIAEASTSGEDDDIVSSAARRQLDRVKERTVLTQALLQPDDSVSVTTPMEHQPATEVFEAFDHDEPDILPSVGIKRVDESEWRKVKPRQGILPWLPILLVSMTAATSLARRDTLEANVDAEIPKAGRSTDQACDVVEPRAMKLAINSRILLDAVRSITGVELPSKRNVLVYPFKLLLQHETALRKAFQAATDACNTAAAADGNDGPSDISSTNDVDGGRSNATEGIQRTVPTRLRDELECLIAFMDSDIPVGRPAGTTIDSKVTFDRVHLMYQPGEVLINSNGDAGAQAYRLMHVSGGRRILDPDNHSQSVGPDILEKVVEPIDSMDELAFWTPVYLFCWYLDFDGIEIGPVGHVIELRPFTGRRNIFIDQIRPLVLCPDRAMLEHNLLNRGSRFLEIIQLRHVSYSGRQLPEICGRIQGREHSSVCRYCMDVKTDQELKMECIVDHSTALTQLARLGCNHKVEFHHERRTRSDLRETFELIQCSDRLCTGCTDTWDDRFCDIEDWSRSKKRLGLLSRPVTPSELSQSGIIDNTIIPVNTRLIGYSLNQHIWLPLHIDQVGHIVRNEDPFDRLMLPANLKKIIQASVEMRAPRDLVTQAPGSQAMIRQPHTRVGNTIMLFHGAPGVGKTFAAEAVSQSLQQPLLSFSTAMLGSEPAEFERKLSGFLVLARKWQCVVCLEDADQLAAQRQRNDTSLISSRFIHHLDAFHGILILITNRVGVFDESLRSRIHVPIYFPPLNKGSSRKIWRMTFQNIKEQYPRLGMNMWHLMDFVQRSCDFNRWNGRQIINACETAAMLARYEGDEFTVAHLETVAETSRDFEQYLDDVHVANVFERADAFRDGPSRTPPSRTAGHGYPPEAARYEESSNTE